MKKIKMVLMAAVILASASAFSTRTKFDPPYVKDLGVWVLRTGASGHCSPSTASCTFTRNATYHTPYQDSDFTPADTQMIWVHTP